MLGLDMTCICSEFDHSSFSRYGDMVGAHQTLNGSRDLTTPLSGTVCHPWTLDTIKLFIKFEVSISTHYGVVWVS